MLCIIFGGEAMINNSEIQNLIKQNHLLKWQIAEYIGIADTTFSRWLRTPLNKKKREQVEKAIRELTKVKE